VEAAEDGIDTKTKKGVTFRNILASSPNKAVVMWAKCHGKFLSRYTLDDGPAVHRSERHGLRTLVQYATDEMKGQPVCLKCMENEQQFIAEILSRDNNGNELDDKAVVRVRGWHAPLDYKPGIPTVLKQKENTAPNQRVDTAERYPFVLIMDRGERSLHDACAKERLAGYDLPGIRKCFGDSMSCVTKVHKAGSVQAEMQGEEPPPARIHGDLKQRNILRVAEKQTASGPVDRAAALAAELEQMQPRARRDRAIAAGASFAEADALIDAADSVDAFVELICKHEKQTQHAHAMCGELFQTETEVLFAADTEDDTDATWMLCDMDSSTLVGVLQTAFSMESMSSTAVSAYMAPELARCTLAKSLQPTAALSMDIWSMGVVLFELCAGRMLFAQDTNNDEIADLSDQTRLCTWVTISDAELEHVLATCDDAQSVADAKELIRWCLQGNPDERPTAQQVLGHRFLRPDGKVSPQPMRYHAFFSHAQADAGGTVATLYFAYKCLGLHTWLDVRQECLTLEGMKDGVRNSNVFVLVLSEHVLFSWYCQQEMLTALEEAKPIQIIIEEDPRFHPFNKARWMSGGLERTKSTGGSSELPLQIVQMIDEHLPRAVTFRRRDWEQEAMMHELCLRNGIELPTPVRQVWPEGKPPVQVFVIHDREKSGDYLRDLEEELLDRSSRRICGRKGPAQIVFVHGDDDATREDELSAADFVLVFLTAGVLAEGKPSRSGLDAAIAQEADRTEERDRIVTLYLDQTYSSDDGWKFGCAEQKSAPPSIQTCLEQHEAIAYRPRGLCGTTTCEDCRGTPKPATFGNPDTRCQSWCSGCAKAHPTAVNLVSHEFASMAVHLMQTLLMSR
jgi:serine/threonine protein kinase